MKKSVPRPLTQQCYTHHRPYARPGAAGHAKRLVGCASSPRVPLTTRGPYRHGEQEIDVTGGQPGDDESRRGMRSAVSGIGRGWVDDVRGRVTRKEAVAVQAPQSVQVEL